MVRDRSAGAPLPYLYGDDQGIREVARNRQTHGHSRLRQAALAHPGGDQSRLLPDRTKNAAGSRTPGIAARQSAKGMEEKDRGDGCKDRPVRVALRTRRAFARSSGSWSVDF